jgi:uncharacterized protein YndB with AHSA1/START domain
VRNPWKKPENITKWWSPKECTSSIHKMDLTEGGEWLLTIHGPDVKNYPEKEFTAEIIPLEKNRIRTP